jgi:DNA primase
VIITKSLKDVVLLSQLDYPSVAPQAESNTISPDLVAELRKRYTHVMLLYDNDIPGINAANRIAANHNLPLFFMPEGTKDASDFAELYGSDMLLEYITETYETHSNNPQLGS